MSYYFSDRIYYLLARPLAQALRDSGNPDPKLVYTQLYEAFFTRIKVAFFGGVFLGFPVIAAQLWLFVAPGLYRSEKRALLPFLLATPMLFIWAPRWRISCCFRSRSNSSPVSRPTRAAAASRSSCCRGSANISTW